MNSELDPRGGIDTIKALFTYGLAAAVVVGGGMMLFLSRADAGVEDLRVVIAGFIGSSLTFVFGQEVQTRTSRQAASSTAAGRGAETAAVKANTLSNESRESNVIRPVEIVNPEPVPVTVQPESH